MRRRRETSRKPAKAQHKAKRGAVPKAARNRRLFALDKGTEVAQLTRERDDAVEQLSAASEVLRIISSSVGDLEPVFEAGGEPRKCGAFRGRIFHMPDVMVDPGRIRIALDGDEAKALLHDQFA